MHCLCGQVDNIVKAATQSGLCKDLVRKAVIADVGLNALHLVAENGSLVVSTAREGGWKGITNGWREKGVMAVKVGAGRAKCTPPPGRRSGPSCWTNCMSGAVPSSPQECHEGCLLVHNANVCCQVVIQQVLHKIATQEAHASCNQPLCLGCHCLV